jgi:PPOX class probable F420-dependent enzyme
MEKTMEQTSVSLPEWTRKARYINLTTFRRNGQAVPTPVWFVVYEGRLYVTTSEQSGKVRRIRANGRAQVAPSDVFGKPLGAFVQARARVVQDESLLRRAVDAAFDRKYGLQKKFMGLVARLSSRQSGDSTCFIELELDSPSR